MLETKDFAADFFSRAVNKETFHAEIRQLDRSQLIAIKVHVQAEIISIKEQLESDLSCRPPQWIRRARMALYVKRQQMSTVDELLASLKNQENPLENQLRLAEQKVEKLKATIEKMRNDSYLEHFHSICKTALPPRTYKQIQGVAIQRSGSHPEAKIAGV